MGEVIGKKVRLSWNVKSNYLRVKAIAVPKDILDEGANIWDVGATRVDGVDSGQGIGDPYYDVVGLSLVGRIVLQTPKLAIRGRRREVVGGPADRDKRWVKIIDGTVEITKAI
jgi:hypothetical protein